MSDKDFLIIIRDMIKGLSDINAQLAALIESIRKLPDASSITNIEANILLESQKQHNDLACTDDISRLEAKIDSFVRDMRDRIDHIEHEHLPTAGNQPTVDLVKAVLDSGIQTRKLENERADTQEDNKIEEKKLDGTLERFKKWMKFWPLFAAGLFELIRWAYPHIHELISLIRG